MLNAKQVGRYREFYEGARNSGILDSRAIILVGMAAAMAVGCSPLASPGNRISLTKRSARYRRW